MDIQDIDKTLTDLDEHADSDEERKRIVELYKNYKGSDEVITAEEYQKIVVREQVLYRVGSGITELDKIVEGFRPGNVIIISGPTKQGKTTFCQTLTENFTKQDFKCLWFFFDTPAIEVIERFKDVPIFYLPKRNKPEKKIKWIEEKIIEGLVKYDTRLIFVDHLGFLTQFTSQIDNRATELTSIVRELKEIAIRWNVTIFLNHHIRSIDSESTPNWGHLKDSSGPAQDSDITIMVWRERKKAEFGVDFTDNGYVSVQLHRRTGKTGTVRMKFKDGIFVDSQVNKAD